MYYLDREALACLLSKNSLTFSVDDREVVNTRKSPVCRFTLHHRLENWLFHVLPTKRPLRWFHAHFSFIFYLDRKALACLLPMNSLRFYVDDREVVNTRKSPVGRFTLHHRLQNCCSNVLPPKRRLRCCHAHFCSMYYLDREALACLLPMNSLRFYVDDGEVVNTRKSRVGRFTLHHRLESSCFKCYQQNVRYVGATPNSLLCTTLDREALACFLSENSWNILCRR